jgi:hypothetical protein
MIWLTERVSRYAIPITMPCGNAAVVMLTGLVEACEQIPSHLLRSLLFDQGSEWAEWETIAVSYRIDCWFCEPHSPCNAARSRTSTARSGSGSHAAPTSPPSPQSTPLTPPRSSTDNAAAHSTTRPPFYTALTVQ